MSPVNVPQIVFYGATWCADCARSKAFLDSIGVTYQFINLEEDETVAAKVTEINHGFQSISTIIFPDESVLVEPTFHLSFQYNQYMDDYCIILKHIHTAQTNFTLFADFVRRSESN